MSLSCNNTPTSWLVVPFHLLVYLSPSSLIVIILNKTLRFTPVTASEPKVNPIAYVGQRRYHFYPLGPQLMENSLRCSDNRQHSDEHGEYCPRCGER